MATHFNGSPEEKQALDTYIKLLRATETVSTRIHRHLAETDLTVSQFGVLEALLHLGPLCQRDIGRKILRSGGNMTLVIDNLEKRGLVERCRGEEDRRFIEVRLTPAGQELIEQVFPRHAQTVKQAFTALSEVEQQELSRLCRTLGLANRG